MEVPNCDVCKNLDLSRFQCTETDAESVPGLSSGSGINVLNKTYELYADRVGVSIGAKRGCWGCQIVQKAYLCLRELGDAYEPDLISICKLNDDCMMIEIPPWYRIEFCTRTGTEESEKWPGIGSRVRIPQESLSEESLNTARVWLKECLGSHPGCKGAENSMLPTRSIRVGSAGESPQLVITQGLSGRYATLSHCWGEKDGPSPLTTTDATLEERMAGIMFQDLPRTFQDAVRVTRHLGLEYLWIDSLCIIQQNADDWAIESEKMQEVYANAELNISADAASNSAEGLERRHRFSPSIELDDNGSAIGWTAKRPILDSYGLESRSRFDSDLQLDNIGNVIAWIGKQPVPDSYGLSHNSALLGSQAQADAHPLHTRAWVLQERMLSRRILHFCASELAWECTTHTRCECEPESRAPSKAGHRDMFYGKKAKKLDPQAWTAIVERYSGLGLTVQSDKAIAIAGVAKQVAARGGSITYTAGLWEEHLPQCLLWYTEVPEHRTSGDYVSWSWTSITSPVKHKDVFTISLASNWNEWRSNHARISWHSCAEQHPAQDKRKVMEITASLGQKKLVEASFLDIKYMGGRVNTFLDVDTSLVEKESGDDYILLLISSALLIYGLVIRETQDLHDGYRTFRRIGCWKFQADMYAANYGKDFLSQKQMSLLGIKEETFLLM